MVGAATLEDSSAASYKTKHALPRPPSNCVLWYLLNDLKTCIHTQKNCTQMFTAALSIIAKNLEAIKMCMRVYK